MMTEYIGYLISAVVSGSLAWLATIKFTRKQAEADAMASVQNVYQELIEDLKSDREELRNENITLRDELRLLKQRLEELESKCSENARRVEEMQPNLCYCKNCPNRIGNKE